MTTMKTLETTTFVARGIALGAALALAVGCGGSAKVSGGAGGGVAGLPPPTKGGGDADPGEKREISSDERKDYTAAVELFAQSDKSGWNESACRSSADRFAGVVRAHPKLVEAQYMVGLSFHRCNLLDEAEKAYQETVRMNPNHGQSRSNLGEIMFRRGKVEAARSAWKSAVEANGKLSAARANLASLMLEEMRRIGDRDSKWKKLEEDARFELSSSLGVDSDNVKTYTLYGLVYMEGFKKNRNRLDLAKTLLDEAKKRNDKYAPLQNAYGLYYMHRNALSEALQHFSAAVASDPNFAEARLNVGLVTLGFRKYDTAKEQFSKVLELAPKSPTLMYDAYIGLGAALRGLKDLDGAEANYKKASQLDPKRGEAFYNLAVLYKDFRANKQEDLKQSQATYRQAKEFFQQFTSKKAEPEDVAEAKVQIGMIDKTIAQLDTFIKAQANQPPAPPAPKK